MKQLNRNIIFERLRMLPQTHFFSTLTFSMKSCDIIHEKLITDKNLSSDLMIRDK